MSDTPRTDELADKFRKTWNQFAYRSDDDIAKQCRNTDEAVLLARDLERELAAAIEQRDKLAVALNSIKNLHKYWQNDKEIAQYSVKMANEVLKELWKECGK